MRADMILRAAGGWLAGATLLLIFYGIWRGMHQASGPTSGRSPTWLRSPWFYLASGGLFFATCWLAWIPLPPALPSAWSAGMAIGGAFLYFPGMALVWWGRLALGRNYFVSSGLGAQLFSDHQLVTGGPFALVRHPMYTGLFLAAAGSLLMYFTWTTLLFVCFAPFLSLRARREEAALAGTFGEAWRTYCRRVPAFFPRLWKREATSNRGASCSSPKGSCPISRRRRSKRYFSVYGTISRGVKWCAMPIRPSCSG